MILKTRVLRKKNKKINLSKIANKFLTIYFVITIITGVVLGSVIIKSQAFYEKKINLFDKISKAGRMEYIYLPKILFDGFKSNFYKIEEIKLNINFKNLLILEKERKNAIINNGLPKRDLLSKVNISIISKSKKMRGDARLKGDRLIHYNEKNKISYKIELDDNNYLFGVKKFSLQKPRARNYIHEWLFHKFADELGLINLKYKFINLEINGDSKGLYVLEEGFGKELIERNNRRNGPIFGIDEDLFINQEKLGEEELDFNNPIFEIYNKRFWQKPENRKLLQAASSKLINFFYDKSKIEEVFDLKLWAKYFAVIDITKNYHGSLLKSVKFYYNPINGLFEPIPFDGHRKSPNFHKFNSNYDNRLLIDIIKNPTTYEKNYDGVGWLKKIFYKNDEINQDFYNLYIEELYNISSNKFIGNFLEKNLKKIKKINSHIYNDYFYFDNVMSFGPGLYYFSIKDFNHTIKNINKKLNSKEYLLISKIDKNKYLIKNVYDHYSNLYLQKFICYNQIGKIEIKINKLINNFNNTIVDIPSNKTDISRCTHANFINKYSGNSKLITIDYINSNYDYEKFKNKEAKFFNIFFFQDGKNLYLKKNETIINKNLYIPKGFKVIVKPKQKLILTNDAFIISNSPWLIGGENGQTIITGEKDNFGGGILITDAVELSKISNTKFSYLSGYKSNINPEFIIHGSINFNQTNVEIKDVIFENIYSEDAINIFRSNFTINNNSFKNIASDAIDIDFSNGKINFVNFINVKNDGIDFSGSKVNVFESNFDNINDKIISAGENSIINITKINAKNSHAGIVSKDGSIVYSKDVNFDGVLIPFAAYQKKREYNYGLLKVKNYNISNFFTRGIKDKGSSITVDDSSIEKETKKILLIVNEKKFSLLKKQ